MTYPDPIHTGVVRDESETYERYHFRCVITDLQDDLRYEQQVLAWFRAQPFSAGAEQLTEERISWLTQQLNNAKKGLIDEPED